MITLENIAKVYETDELYIHAVQDVSLEIGAGEFVAIQGASGSGKSTLLHVLGLLDRPSSGRYRLGERDVTHLGASERAQLRAQCLGFVFQSFNLLGELTVLDNVMLPIKFADPQSSKDTRRQMARDALDRVGLSARANHRPHELSGGQQQRVAVARAIVNRTSVLLADEPTGNLDTATGREIMSLLGDLNRDGMTIVMVTHDAGHARHAQRHLSMADGRLAD